MTRVAVLLALAGCAGAPNQPVAADPASCMGDKFYEGAKSYARCIRHVATPSRADAADPGRDA